MSRRGGAGLRVLLAEDQALVRDGLRLLLELSGFEVVAVENGRQAVDAMRRSPVGEAAGGLPAAGRSSGAPFDAAVLDVRMPVLDGIGCVRALRADFPRLPILMLTTYDDDRLVRECLEAGADAYLLKDIDADHLANAVRLLAAGAGLIPGDLARRIAGAAPDPGGQGAPGYPAPGTAQDPDQSTAEEPGQGIARNPGQGVQDDRHRRPAEARDQGAAGGGGEPLTRRQREILELIAAGLNNREIAERLFLSEGTVKNVVSEIYARLDVRDRVQAVLKAQELRGPGGPTAKP